MGCNPHSLTACSRSPSTAAREGEWGHRCGQAQPRWETGVPDRGVSSRDPMPTPSPSACGHSLPLRALLLPCQMHGLGGTALTLPSSPISTEPRPRHPVGLSPRHEIAPAGGTGTHSPVFSQAFLPVKFGLQCPVLMATAQLLTQSSRVHTWNHRRNHKH